MDKLIHSLSSYKTGIILLLTYATGLALATFVEKMMSTEAAKMLVYYSPLFILLQFLLVVDFILVIVRYNYLKRGKWAMIIIHFALIVILGGALTTLLFGREGQVHIREGERSNQMVMQTSKGIKTETLPFVLELTDFRLHRYPGSLSPSSYESNLRVHIDGEVREAKVFMNNVLDLKGYRFFQASYDEDELGTILSVNKDVTGRNVTYSGYALLLAGFLLMFFVPNSRFRKLIRQLKEVRKEVLTTVFSGILMVMPFVAFGEIAVDNPVIQEDSLNADWIEQPGSSNISDKSIENVLLEIAVPRDHAVRFGALPVQFRGRVMPMNTFSSEILRKIYKEQTFDFINSDQFLLSLLTLPRVWAQVSFIAIPNEQISVQYNLPKDYASYYHFFDQKGNYRLPEQLQTAAAGY